MKLNAFVTPIDTNDSDYAQPKLMTANLDIYTMVTDELSVYEDYYHLLNDDEIAGQIRVEFRFVQCNTYVDTSELACLSHDRGRTKDRPTNGAASRLDPRTPAEHQNTQIQPAQKQHVTTSRQAADELVRESSKPASHSDYELKRRLLKMGIDSLQW